MQKEKHLCMQVIRFQTSVNIDLMNIDSCSPLPSRNLRFADQGRCWLQGMGLWNVPSQVRTSIFLYTYLIGLHQHWRKRTPFGSACCPGSASLLEYEQSINTLRVFLSSGQEIADIATGGHLFDLVLRKDNEYIFKSGDSESTLPSQWLLRDVVPAVEPYLLGETWWEEYLLVFIRSSTHHPCLVDTLRKCSITTVRSVLIMFIFTLMHDPHLDERKRKEF